MKKIILLLIGSIFLSSCATIVEANYNVRSYSIENGTYHYWIAEKGHYWGGFEYITTQKFELGDTILITNIKD